jgi:hypothetical protein
MLRHRNITSLTDESSTSPGSEDAALAPSTSDRHIVDHGRFLPFMRLRTSGYFYKLDSQLDVGTAQMIFDRIEGKRGVTPVSGAAHFRGSPSSHDRVALCVFEVRRPPVFAPTAKELIETRYAFCCLIEVGNILVVAHAGFAWSDALLPFDEPQRLTHDDARAVLGSMKTPRVDKVATRSMSVAAKSIYARTVEGDDLEASLPSAGANRHVVSAIRTVEAKTGATISLVPGSSRLTQLGPRIEFEKTIAWVRKEMVLRLASRKRFRFLSRFAAAIPFDQLPTTVDPTGLSLALGLPMFDGLDWEREGRTGTKRQIPAAQMRQLFDRLRLRLATPVAIKNRNGKLVASYPAPIGDVFLIENKKSYSIENDFLRRLRFIDPETQVPRPLISALNENRSFLVTYSDLQYAYVNGQLVRTAHVADSLDVIVRAVEVHEELARATSEKGKLRGKVDPNSLFGVIEARCAKSDSLLLLDDGSTEWADYIGLATSPSAEPVLTFYHAKHTGKPSTSASVLQEVIGQAEKNLGWLGSSPDTIKARDKDVWSKPYKWPGGGTVGRVRRKRAKKKSVAEILCDVAANPKTKRRACIVVSSLTRTILKRLAGSKGIDLKPNETQLAWLLAMFVSGCADAGVQPVIMCPR